MGSWEQRTAGFALTALVAVGFALLSIGAPRAEAWAEEGYAEIFGRGDTLIVVNYLKQSTGKNPRVTRIEIQQRVDGKWVRRAAAPVKLGTGKYARIRLDWDHSRLNGRIVGRLQLFSKGRSLGWTPTRVIRETGRPFRARTVSPVTGHTCATRLDHRLACWGWGVFGSLGDGREKNVDVVRPRPILRAGRVRRVDALLEHTCGVRFDRRAICWGSNSWNQIGRGAGYDQKVPFTIRGLRNLREVSTGWAQTCAIKLGGQGYCWGDDVFGALGVGKQKRYVQPHKVKNLSDAIRIESGVETNCAIRRSGRLVCWGMNLDGLLGVKGPDEIKIPRPVRGLGRVLDVGLSQFYTCALRADRRVTCWGENDAGQLGNGTVTGRRSRPTLVKGLKGAKALSVNFGGACAIGKAGRAWCWGATVGTEVGVSRTWKTPRLIHRRIRFRTISGNAAAGCGVARSRILWCWGENTHGQLGNGTTIDQLAPVRVLARSRKGSKTSPRTTTRLRFSQSDR